MSHGSSQALLVLQNVVNYLFGNTLFYMRLKAKWLTVALSLVLPAVILLTDKKHDVDLIRVTFRGGYLVL